MKNKNGDNHPMDEKLKHDVEKARVKKEHVESVVKALEAMGVTNPEKEFISMLGHFAQEHEKLDKAATKPYGDLSRELGNDDVLRVEVAGKLDQKERFGKMIESNLLREVFGMPVTQAELPQKKADRSTGLGSEMGGVGGSDAGG